MNDDFQPLDLAACYGADWTGRLIRYGTASVLAPRRLRIGPSHIALICEQHGSPVWVESTTLCRYPWVMLGRQASCASDNNPTSQG